MAPQTTSADPAIRRAYAAWILVCVVWGTTYLAIRIALETVPPMLMAAIRWIVAGSILLGYLRLRGVTLPRRRSWPSLALIGVLMTSVGNGAVVWAEQSIPSGLAALLVAAVPFWMVGVERMMPGPERVTPQRLVGLLVGFTGIVLLVWPELTHPAGSGVVAGAAATQLACVGWAIGSSYSRRRTSDENVIAAAAVQMLFGGGALLVVGLLVGEWSSLAFNVRTASAVTYLVVAGSIAAFSAYLYALKHLPVATVSLYAYVNPVIAVALGTAMLGEPFSPRLAVAGAVVLAGMVLGASSLSGSLHDPPAAHQPHQEQHDGDDQQHVDEVTERVAAHHPKQPEHQQNHRDRLEHCRPPSRSGCNLGAQGVRPVTRRPALSVQWPDRARRSWSHRLPACRRHGRHP